MTAHSPIRHNPAAIFPDTARATFAAAYPDDVIMGEDGGGTYPV